ncbi:hypothetical protein [Paraburkholderia phenazinium]|uniref:hypothetical protein n=1 Tax=Paraburkholderia phenazinium TaxID=60549 RepID=UPI001552816B|nr:hypothetical protein [Paraburkholderia phenazinium]
MRESNYTCRQPLGWTLGWTLGLPLALPLACRLPNRLRHRVMQRFGASHVRYAHPPRTRLTGLLPT